jgi:hypothetical protein
MAFVGSHRNLIMVWPTQVRRVRYSILTLPRFASGGRPNARRRPPSKASDVSTVADVLLVEPDSAVGCGHVERLVYADGCKLRWCAAFVAKVSTAVPTGVDAEGLSMRTHLGDPPLRRGVIDGAIVAVVIAIVLILSEVVYPRSPSESDSDPEYARQLLAAYLLLFLFFLAVGVHARWRGRPLLAGVKGGMAAGVTITVIVFAVTAFIDNTFLSIVSQQHDKRMAFERSGLSSMRLFLNLQNLAGLAVVVPGSALVGGAISGIGGLLGGPLTRRRLDRTSGAAQSG